MFEGSTNGVESNHFQVAPLRNDNDDDNGTIVERKEEPIPYMAIAPDEGWNTLVQDSSDISGDYIIEEKDDRAGEAVYRRLVFLQNQHFVQTEARMVIRSGGSSGHKKNTKRKSSNSKSKAKQQHKSEDNAEFLPIDDFEFDYSYLDYHHRCFLSALVLTPTILKGATNQRQEPSSSSSPAAPKIFIVGFAGGAICMAAQKYLPRAHITTCDLDGIPSFLFVKYMYLYT